MPTWSLQRARDRQRDPQLEVAHPRRRDQGDPSKADSLERHTQHDERPIAETFGRRSGNRRDRHRRAGPGKQSDSSPERGVPEGRLEKLSHQEHRPEAGHVSTTSTNPRRSLFSL